MLTTRRRFLAWLGAFLAAPCAEPEAVPAKRFGQSRIHPLRPGEKPGRILRDDPLKLTNLSIDYVSTSPLVQADAFPSVPWSEAEADVIEDVRQLSREIWANADPAPTVIMHERTARKLGFEVD